MLLVIQDETLSAELIAQRRASGQDKYDEIGDGVYVMAPMADNEHQDLVNAFSTALTIAWDVQGLGRTQPGANVSNDGPTGDVIFAFPTSCALPPIAKRLIADRTGSAGPNLQSKSPVQGIGRWKNWIFMPE